MNPKIREKIAKALSERIVNLECPMCHKKEFTLMDEYSPWFLIKRPNESDIRKFSFIPSATIVCRHCGFISRHNIPILGIDADEIINDKQNN